MAQKLERNEAEQVRLIDRMHTLLAGDCERAGDTTRAQWHITRRDWRRYLWDRARGRVGWGYLVKPLGRE
jgi:hypothetical protein